MVGLSKRCAASALALKGKEKKEKIRWHKCVYEQEKLINPPVLSNLDFRTVGGRTYWKIIFYNVLLQVKLLSMDVELNSIVISRVEERYIQIVVNLEQG